MSYYTNLAGNKNSDEVIRRELNRVGVDALQLMQRSIGEVPYSVIGEVKTRHFGQIRFRRAWRYWVVEGLFPIEFANEIYKNHIIKDEARVGGDCGCREPKTWSKRLNGNKIVPAYGERQTVEAGMRDGNAIWTQVWQDPKFHWPESQEEFLSYPQFVDMYHIDSELAMYLFVEKLKQEGNALLNDEL